MFIPFSFFGIRWCAWEAYFQDSLPLIVYYNFVALCVFFNICSFNAPLTVFQWLGINAISIMSGTLIFMAGSYLVTLHLILLLFVFVCSLNFFSFNFSLCMTQIEALNKKMEMKYYFREIQLVSFIIFIGSDAKPSLNLRLVMCIISKHDNLICAVWLHKFIYLYKIQMKRNRRL